MVGPNVSVPTDVEESADDLIGDGINIAARLEGSLSPALRVSRRRPTDR
jgi:class 3 adenylate cyclase